MTFKQIVKNLGEDKDVWDEVEEPREISNKVDVVGETFGVYACKDVAK